MKIHEVEQGTQEWLDLHVGIPTASRFGKLITAKTKKPSAQAVTLAYELCGEEMLGECVNTIATQFMQRGLKLEDEAVRWYEFDRECDVRRIGFATLDDESAGCSPDGLIGEDGGLEVKIPGAVKYIEYLVNPRNLVDAYFAQSQGGMWICDRTWWDVMAYHPAIQPLVVRIERDDEYIAALEQAVRKVNAKVREWLVCFGYRSADTARQKAEAAPTCRRIIHGKGYCGETDGLTFIDGQPLCAEHAAQQAAMA